MSKEVVFCDFDGTITERDGFVAVCRHFAPEAVSRWLPGVLDGSISLRKGLTEMLESIPSCHHDAMMAHCDAIAIRPGFEALLDYLAEREIPFVVISGGLKGLVERKLGPLVKKTAGIYAPELDATGPKLKVVSAFPGERELLAKVDVMKNYPCKTAIAIGDGITDYNMAQRADRVFARHQLADHMASRGLAYEPWEDFYDVLGCFKGENAKGAGSFLCPGK